MHLNNEQTKAVLAPLANVFVEAGAGAGKTRVLIARIANLINVMEISPSNILALTYTRKAANEMRERLRDLLGNRARGVTISTIHGFCLTQLYRFGDKIGWNPDTMSVFSQDESKELLNYTLEDLGFRRNGKRTGGPSAKEIKQAFFEMETKREAGSSWDRDLSLVVSRFFNDCRKFNTMTYPMILLEFHRLINSSSQVREIIRREYPHMLIDEVQDTTMRQWLIVSDMSPASIFAVGDLRQSIFSFAGAEPQYTMDHVSPFEPRSLAMNYRSCSGIVRYGNAILADYSEMQPVSVYPGDIRTVVSDSKSILSVVDTALQYFAPEDIAILCRVHRPLAKCVDALREGGLPVCYPKGDDKGDHPHLRIIHAYLALSVNRFDLFAFLTIAAYLGLDNITKQEIRSEAIGKGINFVDVAKLCGISLDIPWGEFDSGIVEWVQTHIASFQDDSDTAIQKYLKWYSMRDLQFNQEQIPKEHIQALSIHQAKGLEWPCVVLIGATEGILPSNMAKTPEEIEEERRLFYVAVTRAKEMLIISPRPEGEVSRFIGGSV